MNEIIKVEYHRSYCSDSDFSEYEFDQIKKEIGEFDWCVYSYGTGSFEGDGVMVHKKDGKYYQTNLGHGSYYGPLDSIETKTGYDSIDELLKNCSEGLNGELKPLIEKIKELEK